MSNPPNDWKRRRNLVYFLIGFCVLGISYTALHGGPHTSFDETLISNFFMLLGAVVTGYMGFRVWDVKNKPSDN